MNKIQLKWSDFKNIIDKKNLNIQIKLDKYFYNLLATDGNITYQCDIYKDSVSAGSQLDFESNYLSLCDKPLVLRTKEGKEKTLSISRPENTYTFFTTRGDIDTKIAGGKRIEWDFSNTNDDVVSNKVGFKKKEIEVSFIDEVWLKEGAIYFFNKLKGSYICIYIICPQGQYYFNNAGNPVMAMQDTKVVYYVARHSVQGSVPMGVNFNTEGATEQGMPTGYKILIEVSVPNSDNSSNGVIEIECYRERTVIL